MTKWTILIVALVALAPRALAQQSTSYKLEGTVVNAGGHPSDGVTLASAGYLVKLDSIGDGVVQSGFGSASFHMDWSFVTTYAPPGEVLNLRFTGAQTLAWNPERSVGKYEVYRAGLSTLPGSFGACLTSGLTTATTTDFAVPPVGGGYFYLVTARNRLDQEGTKGFSGNGVERPNLAPCP